jgi:signal transduction histidine kinase
VIAIAGCVAAAAAFVGALTNDAVGNELGEPLVIASLVNWLTVSYVVCGVIAWSRSPGSGFGPLMVAAGFANCVATLSWVTSAVPFTIGQLFDLIPPVIFLHLFLAHPSGRLSGFERRLVVFSYVTAVSFQLVRMLYGDFGPHNLLNVAHAPRLAETAMTVQFMLISAGCLCGVVVLAIRRMRAGRPLRRARGALVDAFALGLVMIALLFASSAFDGPAVVQIRWATLGTLALAPLAFLIGLLESRLARSSVGDLFVDLRPQLHPIDLRQALARALRDPSLMLAYWLPQFRSWADLDGQAVELPSPGDGRVATLIDRDGEHVAALLHDPALCDEPELLDAVAAAAGIAIENGRLQVELRARLEELKGSRARIVEAGQEERRRLERNLHDSAQQRLVALSLELSLLEQRLAGDPELRTRLHRTRGEVALSLRELRDVARGIHPAVVSAHGLAVALEELAAKATVPVRLWATSSRLPEAIEVAAFYLVSEALANVAKHANATSVTVEVARTANQVVIEVIDDGVGGADTERGSGLRGLADRVEALDGTLRIWSRKGEGTRVMAELPCES